MEFRLRINKYVTVKLSTYPQPLVFSFTRSDFSWMRGQRVLTVCSAGVHISGPTDATLCDRRFVRLRRRL